MVDRHLLAAKLAELEDRVARIRARCPESVEELRADRDALDLVSFNLMLAVQSCSDIASHIIADEGWPAPANLAGAFTCLRDRQVLSATTASSLCRAVGLRNVVAHGYAKINAAMVFSAASPEGLGELDAFAQQVARWMGAPQGT